MRALVAGAIACLILAMTIHSPNATALSTNWQHAKKYFDLRVANDLTEVDLRVVVHAVTLANITTSWIIDDTVQQATYDRATREDRAEPGNHAWLWVTTQDVSNGGAWIGKRYASLVSSNVVYHLFVSGLREYYYSATTGVLIRMHDLGTGTEVTKLLDGDVVTLPTADNDPRQTIRDVRDFLLEVVPAEEEEVPPATVTLTCGGILEDPTGGTATCSDTFRMKGSYKLAGTDLDWPILSAGYMNVTFSDSNGEYIAYECYTDSPYVAFDDEDPAICYPEPWYRGSAAPGEIHTWRLRVGFSYCLNPLAAFACEYGGSSFLTGRVSEE